MWKYANQIIAVGWQINSFYQIDWKIVDAMLPDSQVSDPVDSMTVRKK